MPYQREGTDEQAKERQRTVRQMQQTVGNSLFIAENQIQRPDGYAKHNQHVGKRAHLHIHLIGNYGHRDQQAITNQTAQNAEAQRPVFGAVVIDRERAQIRDAGAKYQA
ncbi:hypothetical protein D3C71_1128240 [compost metagenome]